MSNHILKYLGPDVVGLLRKGGLYPVLTYSDNGLPVVLTDSLESVEVSDFEFVNYEKKKVKLPQKSKFDSVETPYHYASTSIECIDAMESAFGKEFVKNFCIGNAFKYLWRHDKKGNSKEDIQKCKRYLEMYLKAME